LYLTQSLKTEQTAIYRELVRNVNDIKKSQSRIIADMTHEKPAPLPPGFVGSGFLVSANGYIVTSYHVVKGADSVFVENSNFGRLKTSVILSDPANDVSVLKIDSTQTFNLKSLPYLINPMEANLGEDVFTLGFPREDIVFGEGSISATTGYQQNPNSYQVSVPVNPGNSGGPLFNAKGDLVGIISGAQTETSGAAFAIKSSVLLDVIKNIQTDSLQSPLNLPRQNSLRYLSKVDQVKKWKEYVFVVQVYNHK
jgi:S1-C subfamily serine protease